MGMSKAFDMLGDTSKKVFGIVGDSTFFHSGMTGAAEILYNKGNMIPVVLDNSITGMTGQQENPGSGENLMGEPAPSISIEKVLEAFGYQNVIIVDPQDLTAMQKAVDDALASEVPAAIITRRPCLLIKKIKHNIGKCNVNADKCRSCKKCLKVGCPAIFMKDGKATIDQTLCVGCTVCNQVCPFGAIEKEGE
jgi:indolepyruvate ferredoxin oxidoreductase alpha subunit